MALTLWLLTSIAAIAVILRDLTPLLAFLAGQMFYFERKKDGKTIMVFRWHDWIGLFVVFNVVYAIYIGTDPITLLKIIGNLFNQNGA